LRDWIHSSLAADRRTDGTLACQTEAISIVVRQALAGASFTSPKQVRVRIDAFIAAYNPEAYPFEWTKQVVFSKHPRAKYAK
jgi:hypothetical protein